MKKLVLLIGFVFLGSCGGSQTLNVIVIVTGLGEVKSNPIVTGDVTYTIDVGTDNDTGDALTDGTAKIEKGETATITAIPNDGSTFVEWSSTDENFACTTGTTCSFIVTDDVTINATFAP